MAFVAGTSLVSHGVDLARLNMLHVAGMPSTNAYYVQATARAGRTDVGVVLTAFSRVFARDRSAFHFFEPQHAYSAQLVEAVSLNRFAVNSPKKTATGMLSAVIINRIARDPVLNPANRERHHESVRSPRLPALAGRTTRHHRRRPGRRGARCLRARGTGRLGSGRGQLLRRQRCGDGCVTSWRSCAAGTQHMIQKCFLNKPPTSFRDIDEAVEFGAYGYVSEADFRALVDRNQRNVVDESEAPVAVEEEDA